MPQDIHSQRLIHVVAAALIDERGAVLLGRRRPDQDLAGLWEFPGGKVEVGESSIAALNRELNEELGIEVLDPRPLADIGHEYPHQTVRLEVWWCRQWTGQASSREGQAIAWVMRQHLPIVAMPPADAPIVSALIELQV